MSLPVYLLQYAIAELDRHIGADLAPDNHHDQINALIESKLGELFVWPPEAVRVTSASGSWTKHEIPRTIPTRKLCAHGGKPEE